MLISPRHGYKTLTAADDVRSNVWRNDPAMSSRLNFGVALAWLENSWRQKFIRRFWQMGWPRVTLRSSANWLPRSTLLQSRDGLHSTLYNQPRLCPLDICKAVSQALSRLHTKYPGCCAFSRDAVQGWRQLGTHGVQDASPFGERIRQGYAAKGGRVC